MPTYEYACPKCGIFEKFQSMKDEPLSKCPTCRRKVKRQIGTGAGIIFKGSGFYQTDYRSDGYKKAAKTDSPSTSTPSSTPSSTPPTPAPSAPASAPAVSAAPAKSEKKSS